MRCAGGGAKEGEKERKGKWGERKEEEEEEVMQEVRGRILARDRQ